MKRTLVSATVVGAAIVLLAPAAAHAKLVADWAMDEPANATTMVDSSPEANNGSITSVVTGRPGLVSGFAYDFNGTTSFVSVPDDPTLDPEAANITLEATVKVAVTTMPDDSMDLVRKGVTTTTGGDWKMEIKRASDPTVGKLLCVFKDRNRVVVQRNANVDIVDGQQHTVKCIKTATQVKAVVDARTFTTTKSVGSISNDQPVVLGSKVAGDDVLQGTLDQVRLNIG